MGELGYPLSNSDDITDEFVARYSREYVTEGTGGDEEVCVAHAAGEDLNKNLAGTGLLQFEILEGDWLASFRDNSGLKSLG